MRQQLLIAQVLGRGKHQVPLAVTLALVQGVAPGRKNFGAAQRQRRLGRLQKRQRRLVHQPDMRVFGFAQIPLRRLFGFGQQRTACGGVKQPGAQRLKGRQGFA